MDGASTWKKSELVSVLWRFLGLFLPSMLAWDLQTRKLSLRQYLFGCNLSYHFPFTTQLYTPLLRNPYYCTSSLHSNALQWHTSLHWKTLYCTLALQTNALPLHTSLCKENPMITFPHCAHKRPTIAHLIHDYYWYIQDPDTLLYKDREQQCAAMAK
jgi:hypothetical protein